MSDIEAVVGHPDANWTQVWFVDPSRLDRKRRARLGTLLLRRGLGHAFDEGGEELLRILTYRASLYACDLDSDALRSMLRHACEEAVRRLGRSARVRADLDPSQPMARWLAAVFEATWAYCSRASDDLATCMRESAECLDEIVRTWPGALVSALNLLDGIMGGTPVGAAGLVWDLAANLRGRCGR